MFAVSTVHFGVSTRPSPLHCFGQAVATVLAPFCGGLIRTLNQLKCGRYCTTETMHGHAVSHSEGSPFPIKPTEQAHTHRRTDAQTRAHTRTLGVKMCAHCEAYTFEHRCKVERKQFTRKEKDSTRGKQRTSLTHGERLTVETAHILSPMVCYYAPKTMQPS